MKITKYTPITITALIISVLITGSNFNYHVSAADSSDSAATVDPETVKENIKKRIQEVVTQGQNVLGIQTIIKGWTGKIETITTDTITITSEEKTRLVSINADTDIVRAGKDAKLADLSIGDFVIAMGNPDGNDILNTIRLVASDEEPDKPKQRVLFGTLTNIDTKKNTLIMTSTEGTNTLTLTKNTKTTEELPLEKDFKVSELNIADEAIAIYTVDEKDPSLFNLIRLHRTKAATPPPSPEEE